MRRSIPALTSNKSFFFSFFRKKKYQERVKLLIEGEEGISLIANTILTSTKYAFEKKKEKERKKNQTSSSIKETL